MIGSIILSTFRRISIQAYKLSIQFNLERKQPTIIFLGSLTRAYLIFALYLPFLSTDSLTSNHQKRTIMFINQRVLEIPRYG